MKKTSFNLKIVSIALCACLLVMYFVYQFVLFSKAEMETQPALKETVYSTISTKAFVVRDESVIIDNTKGTTVSFAKNGERVAVGDTVSIIFNSQDDASAYLKISELRKSAEHYKELSGQANFQSVNIDSLNVKINDELTEFLESRDKNEQIDAVSNAEKLMDTLTGKQIATGTAMDFSKQLAAINSQLSELEKTEYTYTEIKSNSSGYYINGSDGYENTIDFSKIDEIDLKTAENAIKAKPQSIPQGAIGRVVGSFEWYIVCSVPTDKTVDLTVGKTFYVNIQYKGIERLPVTLYKVGERTEDNTMLILSCNLMNESLADLRCEDIQLITEEYTGYKISNSAIRTVDGVKGVYVVRGNLLGFRKIHIVYSTDKFTIVDNPEGDSGYIRQYDEVVTKGVELYDNKLV